MEQSKGSTPTEIIRRRVKDLRTRRGLTAEALAKRLADQGVPWQRSTVAKLETGKRESVTVVELLALAVALNVAPVHLLVPLADDEPYQVTPEGERAEQSAALVREWVRGRRPLPGMDQREFFSEVPEAEFETPRFSQPGPIPPGVLEAGENNG